MAAIPPFQHLLFVRRANLHGPTLLGLLPEPARLLSSMEAEEIIEDVLETEDLCWGLRPQYVERALRHCDVGLITESTDGSYTVLGVATLRVVSDALDIELFCTHPGFRGMGRHLLACLQQFQNALGRAHMRVCSSQSAVGFYRHMGFTNVSEPQACTPPLVALKRGGRIRRRKSGA